LKPTVRKAGNMEAVGCLIQHATIAQAFRRTCVVQERRKHKIKQSIFMVKNKFRIDTTKTHTLNPEILASIMKEKVCEK